MLSQEENELLTRVGPGTPMGDTLRRYWIPALLSWELEADGAPVRTRLLGEDLVAFRATNGEVGVLDEICPHRATSLWLGRNEGDGLRCVYHGWKFNVSGQCVDQMNEPHQFASKIKMLSYPAVERGGAVWVYMGPPEHQPSPPNFDWTKATESQRGVTRIVEECNWLQALEGGIDTSHAPILHRALNLDPSQPGIPANDVFVTGSAPVLELDETDYGYRYYGIRQLKDDEQYVRGYHYVMPWTQLRPAGRGVVDQTHGHHWVPMDDHTTLVWNFYYTYEGDLPDITRDPQSSGNSFNTDIDVANGFRAVRNRSNDWMIDRAAQKTETFSGIQGVNVQDRAVQELMGPIVDRTKEHLGPADKAIITMRKLLARAVRTVADGGDPPGVTDNYYDLRAEEGVMPADADWREALLPAMDPNLSGN
jgi:phthalate 4,5-dioxygenase oxygenase subunit